MALVSEDGRRLEPVASHDPNEDGVETLAPGAEDRSLGVPGGGTELAALVVETGRPLFVPDSTAGSRGQSPVADYQAQPERSRSPSLLIVPLRAQGKVIGTLGHVARAGKGPVHRRRPGVPRGARRAGRDRRDERPPLRGRAGPDGGALDAPLPGDPAPEGPVARRSSCRSPWARSGRSSAPTGVPSPSWRRTADRSGSSAAWVTWSPSPAPPGRGRRGVRRRPKDGSAAGPRGPRGRPRPSGRGPLRSEVGPQAFIPLQSEAGLVGRPHRRPAEDAVLEELLAGRGAPPVHLRRDGGECAPPDAPLRGRAEAPAGSRRALRRIDLAIIGTTDARVPLQVVLEEVRSLLLVEAADVLVHDPRFHSLSWAAGFGFGTPAVQHAVLRVGEGHAGLVALERRTLRIADLGARRSSARARRPPDERGLRQLHRRPPREQGAGPRRPRGLPQEAVRAGLRVARGARRPRRPGQPRDRQRVDVRPAPAFAARPRARVRRDDRGVVAGARPAGQRDRGAHAAGQGDDAPARPRDGVPGGRADPDPARGAPPRHRQDGGPGRDPPEARARSPTAEWLVMRQHPQLALELLSPIAYLRPAIDIPFAHHERWDGTGYPARPQGQADPACGPRVRGRGRLGRPPLGPAVPRRLARGEGAGPHREPVRAPTSTRRSWRPS